MSLKSHQKTTTENTNEWLTPKWIIDGLGRFDLDPCSPINRPWDTAIEHFNKNDDGLKKPWHGRVWLNPPYGKYKREWMKKMANHGNGIAIIPACTETKVFFENVWPIATAILFMKGRPTFLKVDGTPGKTNCGSSMCLISYSLKDKWIMHDSGIPGKFISLGN